MSELVPSGALLSLPFNWEDFDAESSTIRILGQELPLVLPEDRRRRLLARQGDLVGFFGGHLKKGVISKLRLTRVQTRGRSFKPGFEVAGRVGLVHPVRGFVRVVVYPTTEKVRPYFWDVQLPVDFPVDELRVLASKPDVQIRGLVIDHKLHWDNCSLIELAPSPWDHMTYQDVMRQLKSTRKPHHAIPVQVHKSRPDHLHLTSQIQQVSPRAIQQDFHATLATKPRTYHLKAGMRVTLKVFDQHHTTILNKETAFILTEGLKAGQVRCSITGNQLRIKQ